MLSDYFAARGILQSELPSGGVIQPRFSDPAREHLATRRGVGIFDFSFMGSWAFSGEDALACLDRLQTRDLKLLPPGRLCYTLLCHNDGSVLIDATVWCHDQEHYWLFTGRQSDLAHLKRCAQGFRVEITALATTHAVVAIQGPASAALLGETLPGSGDALAYFSFRRYPIEGCDTWIARLGYTGELGYELLLPGHLAQSIWSRLADSPFDSERLECGMQAANSLRIEAGYIHFAHELEGRVFPAELGLSRLVQVAGRDFIGRDALACMRAVPRRIAGVKLEPSSSVLPHEARRGEPIVHLTSEAYSPLFRCVLGLALVDADIDLAGAVYTDDGRKGTLARLPFRDPTRSLVQQSNPVR